MSYLEKVKINIKESWQGGDLSYNLLLLDKRETGSSDTDVVSYTSQSDLVVELPIDGADETIRKHNKKLKNCLEAIFSENSGVNKVYTYTVLAGDESSLTDIMRDNSIWATVIISDIKINTGVTADDNATREFIADVVGALPSKGVVLVPLADTGYLRPAVADNSDRLAYYRVGNVVDDGGDNDPTNDDTIAEVEPVAVNASLALSNQPHRTWANRLMRFRPQSTFTNLQELEDDKVNAFYIEGANNYSGNGFLSTGKYIDNQFSKDYLVSYLRNKIKEVLFKLPTYDFVGIGQIESAMVETFEYLGDYGIIENLGDKKYNYEYSIPNRAEQKEEDKQDRRVVATAKVFFAGSVERFGIDIEIVEI